MLRRRAVVGGCVLAVALGLLAVLWPVVVQSSTAQPAPTTRPAASGLSSTSGAACEQGTVALTFDAGPDPQYTPGIVAILERDDVPATFFMLGDRVDEHPALARWVAAQGFVVGNHTFDHTDLTTLTRAAARREFVKTYQTLLRAHVVRPQLTGFVRMPFGRHDPQLDRMIRRQGWHRVGWGLTVHDGHPHTTAASIADDAEQSLAAAAAQPGPVYKVMLLHDGAQRKGYVNHTAQALPTIIADATRLGFCFTGLRGDGHAAATPVTLAQQRALLVTKAAELAIRRATRTAGPHHAVRQ